MQLVVVEHAKWIRKINNINFLRVYMSFNSLVKTYSEFQDRGKGKEITVR